MQTALLAAFEKARSFEHAQVARNRRRGNAERLGKLSDRGLGASQPLENPPPNRIRQRSENRVERPRSMLNHIT